MSEKNTSEQPPADSPLSSKPVSASNGAKGCFACLVVLALLIMLAVKFRPSETGASNLSPGQRQELSRLIGTYEGFASSQHILGAQSTVQWKVRFFLNRADRLKCHCVMNLQQKPNSFVDNVTEFAVVVYQHSEKTGSIMVASGTGTPWSIHVETPVLKSGEEISSVILYDMNSRRLVLRRQ